MKVLEGIDDKLADWLHAQHVFFVATAPLAADGHVNCSPKGGDAFRLLGPMQAGYLDYTGSGAETAAHLRENERILLMFCAFDGPPNIVRLHGKGEYIPLTHPEFDTYYSKFAPNPGARGIVLVSIERVSSSCGFSVPVMDFVEDRQALNNFAKNKGVAGLTEYRAKKNMTSIDGLPAFPGM